MRGMAARGLEEIQPARLQRAELGRHQLRRTEAKHQVRGELRLTKRVNQQCARLLGELEQERQRQAFVRSVLPNQPYRFGGRARIAELSCQMPGQPSELGRERRLDSHRL